jgi:hypothetical protein
MSFQIYRGTSVGDSLVETIEQLSSEGKLPEEMAHLVLRHFDTVSRPRVGCFVGLQSYRGRAGAARVLCLLACLPRQSSASQHSSSASGSYVSLL